MFGSILVALTRTRSIFRGRSRSSIERLTGLGITISSTLVSFSGQKRKRDKGSTKSNIIKRFKSDNSQIVATNSEPDIKKYE